MRPELATPEKPAILKENRNLAYNITQIALYFLILLLWTKSILMTYFRAFIMHLPVFGVFADEIILIMYILCIFFSIPAIIKKLKPVDILFVLTVVCAYCLNYMFFTENISVLDENIGVFLLTVLPLYIIGVSGNWEKIYKSLYWLSIATVILRWAYTLFFAAPMDDTASLYEGNMWASYNLLPHVCIITIEALKKWNPIALVGAIFGVFQIATLGSRGPLLCIFIISVLYMFLFRKGKGSVGARLAFLAVFFLLFINLDSVVEFLYNLSEDMGLSVRIFDKYLNKELSDSTGRDMITEQLLTAISQSPILGYGFCADRLLTFDKSYAHNIILELWLSFGVVTGSLIIIAVVILLLKTAKKIDLNSNVCALFIALIAPGFIKLFLSYSFILEGNFFLLIGICISTLRNVKLRNNNDIFENTLS